MAEFIARIGCARDARIHAVRREQDVGAVVEILHHAGTVQQADHRRQGLVREARFVRQAPPEQFAQFLEAESECFRQRGPKARQQASPGQARNERRPGSEAKPIHKPQRGGTNANAVNGDS